MTRKWKIKINMIPCNNLDMGKELSLGESAREYHGQARSQRLDLSHSTLTTLQYMIHVV